MLNFNSIIISYYEIITIGFLYEYLPPQYKSSSVISVVKNLNIWTGSSQYISCYYQIQLFLKPILSKMSFVKLDYLIDVVLNVCVMFSKIKSNFKQGFLMMTNFEEIELYHSIHFLKYFCFKKTYYCNILI